MTLLLLLAACNQHSEHTKDWYLQNTAERVKRVQECKNDTAQLVTPDCQNAVAADDQAKVLGTGNDNTAPRLTK